MNQPDSNTPDLKLIDRDDEVQIVYKTRFGDMLAFIPTWFGDILFDWHGWYNFKISWPIKFVEVRKKPLVGIKWFQCFHQLFSSGARNWGLSVLQINHRHLFLTSWRGFQFMFMPMRYWFWMTCTLACWAWVLKSRPEWIEAAMALWGKL